MRFHRHAAINEIIRNSLSSAGVPACLEPPGLLRGDGKRPDGLSLVSCERGKPLVWDATVPDSMAPSYRSTAITEAGAVAKLSETKKHSKYINLLGSYIFTPVAIESLGAFGHLSKLFIHSLGRRIECYSNDEKATSYLFQRLSIAVQRGNAALIMDT